MLADKIMLYAGMALSSAAILGFIIVTAISLIRKTQLKNIFDAEYGEQSQLSEK